MNDEQGLRPSRTHVPFDGLWSMAIDVPYSYLVRDGELAWTCGQLALGADAEVLHAGDLSAQSSVVSDYVEAIVRRADLDVEGVRRLILYYVPTTEGARLDMLATFRTRFGDHVDLVEIAVPHFYYDGVVLEVDVFWASDAAPVTISRGPGGAQRLSEHAVVCADGGTAEVIDPGAALVVAGLDASVISGIDVVDGAVSQELHNDDGVVCAVRRAGRLLWVQARSTDAGLGLVAQTVVVMQVIDRTLREQGFTFADVVKSTTHYAGDSSAEDLHDNMSVRNGYYTSPGPASTGIPVHGFADSASKIVVDITLIGA